MGLRPGSKTLVAGGIKEETRQVLSNLEHVLIKAGSSLQHVIKTQVLLADMSLFAEMNDVSLV